MTWLNKIWRPAQTIECSVAGPEQGEPPQILHVPDQPDGIKVLHDCPDAKIDVCFVHGLMGDGKSTWTAEGQSLPWPQTLLPGKLTEARILSFGYDADVMNIGICTSKSVLEDHAKILLNDLCLNRDRANASGRPIIFVAHSMGGLVVMNAILLSRNNTESHLRAVFDCTRAVAFIATPHKGSFKATLLQIGTAIAGPFRNGRLLKSLEKEDPLIENVQGRFWSMVRGKHKAGETFEVTCFYETKGYLGQLIVDKSSATVVGQHDLPIIADHINIVKFGSADDPGFNALLGELERWKTRIEEKVVGPRNGMLLTTPSFDDSDPLTYSRTANQTQAQWLRQTFQEVPKNRIFFTDY